MMYIHYCQTCDRIHMLNGHRPSCPRCEEPLQELTVSYSDYVQMDPDERTELEEHCLRKATMQRMKTIYAKPLKKSGY